MVMISHTHRFVFLKTRKTAGTSVEMALEPYCRPAGGEVVEITPAIVSEAGIVGRRRVPPTLLQRLKLQMDWRNHMPAAEVAKAMGQNLFDSYRRITTLRDPFDLAVSRFYWRLKQDGRAIPQDPAETRKLFREITLREPFDFGHAITHIGGRFVPTDVIRFETLGPDLTRLLAELVPGAPAPALPHTKNTGQTRAMGVADHYDAETVDAVADQARWLIDRFGYPTRPAGFTTPSSATGALT